MNNDPNTPDQPSTPDNSDGVKMTQNQEAHRGRLVAMGLAGLAVVATVAGLATRHNNPEQSKDVDHPVPAKEAHDVSFSQAGITIDGKFTPEEEYSRPAGPDDSEK